MKQQKSMYRVLLLSIFIGVNMLILFGIGQLFLYINTGADRSSILHTTLPDAKVYLPKVIWKNIENPGRPIEKETLATIESNYLQAWYIKNIAYKTNTPFGISDFYTQSARTNILNHIQDQKEKNIHIESTSINHNLSIDFYSLDGQLVVLSDHNSRQYQQVFANNNLILETEIEASYKIVLLLEDGFWKVRHLVKQQNPKIEASKKVQAISFNENKEIIIDNTPFKIKGINYYPQATPWNMFGDEFDLTIINNDFKIIANAGLNTIRIFAGYEDFGKAEVIPEKLTKLKQVLNKANANNLKVIVTLFDFYGNYDVLDWTLTHKHAAQMVSALKNHPAILAWDLKNEPDLDFDSRGKTKVLAWLKEMSLQIKTQDSNHLVTIGWSNTRSAHLLQENVDFISFHYYKKLNYFEEKYTELQSKTHKALVLQEFGLASSRGLWNPFGASEKGQAEYYAQFQEIFDKYKLPNLSWTLYDFSEIPTSVAGKLPWRKHQQKHFGFIDKEGNPKEAFKVLKKQ